MNIIEIIMELIRRFFKKESSDSRIEEEDVPVIEEEDVPVIEDTKIKPNLTISTREPSGGKKYDVWMKYDRGE